MSEPKRISPLLDNFAMGEPVSDHHGVCCCPAMANDSDDKYIVKVISVPASQVQVDAMLLTGVCKTQEEAVGYFQELADEVVKEAQTLDKLAKLEGFVGYEGWQCVPKEDAVGFDIYLLGTYKRSLERFFQKNTMTQLGALNLGLDICASLAVCRRSGYLYADLKPGNIFVNDGKEFRIGDLGFISLSSLKYTSLPDKYRSVYTPPEISDAYSALNDTIDVYAAGMILYQAFNGGTLPFTADTRPEDPLPAPVFADYEMAEIILKACDPEPANRWQDPIQMGQAIINYMQRNGANDVPIVPVTVPEEIAEESVAETEPVQDISESVTDQGCEEPDKAELSEQPQEETEQTGSEEVDFENLSFLDEENEDETDPENLEDEIDYQDVSDEVSDILTQADELIAHPAPDPVIPPEKIDVPIPEPIVLEPEKEENCEEETEETSEAERIENGDDEETPEAEPAKKPKKRWLRNSLIILAILGLIAGGVYFFQGYYMQGIASITLEGVQNTLTVYVTPDEGVDASELAVVCYDASGIKYQTPVTGGKAVFSSLMPGRNYQVEVISLGFHKVYGNTTGSYATPLQTNIVQFNAVTGSGSGTAIVSFTVDGPDADSWKLRIFTPGEEERIMDFTGHMVNVSGLSVGKDYSFTLIPSEELHICGDDTISFTASDLILPKDLSITGCTEDTLSAAWSAPEDITVSSWTVHCYNAAGFEATVVTEETFVEIEGIDPTQSYTVDVTASGMSVGERVSTEGNAITVTNVQIKRILVNENPHSLLLSWESESGIPEGGWILQYTVDGYTAQDISCDENSVQISPAIPGADYQFALKAADGTQVLTTPMKHTVPVADSFSGYWVSASDFDFSMCRYPGYEYWDRYDLDVSDYTSDFVIGERASFLVRVYGEYDTSYDDITALYVIRDGNGNIVNFSYRTQEWIDMWYRNYCELDIPSLPQAEGEYTITVFFNGQYAHEQTFTLHPDAAA